MVKRPEFLELKVAFGRAAQSFLGGIYEGSVNVVLAGQRGVGADLMLSLRFERYPSPAANGVASFYFGSSHGSVSTIGRNLADFIQREVVARTGLRDCRTHGRTWDLLRLTRMPTVQVDIGYITNPRDRGLLVSTQTRDAIAEGILAAVKRLYLLGKNDRPTGTFTFAELLAHELSVEQAGRLTGG